MNRESPLLEAQNISKHYSQQTSLIDGLLKGEQPPVKALDGVSIELYQNSIKGVIGESGCGKTTLLKALLGLEDLSGGDLLYRGRSTREFDSSDWSSYRRDIRIIFQDPFDTLDPKMTVRETLQEPLAIHGFENKEDQIRKTLQLVELNPVDDYINRRPKQLSGGERQRVAIARALIVDPDLILADEPVSMLDVSTQASILNLLGRLAHEVETSILYVSHDISTVAMLCEEINVMYLGRIIESAPTKELIDNPKHPYTKALINAVPIPDPTYGRELVDLEGTVPSPINLPQGCRFKDRCPERMDICDHEPREVPVDEDSNHLTACHLYYDHEKQEETNKAVSSGRRH